MRRGRRFYDLTVLPLERGRYGLVLHEMEDLPARAAPQPPRVVARIWGAPMQAILDRVLEAVRSTGAKATDLGPGRREPFRLDEETGVRLGLLFLAVKPLRKASRLEGVRSATAVMGAEEVYYWFAKCRDPERGGRACRAFRILCSQD